MNAMKNRVQLIGHVGNDPEVKEFKENKMVARFSMATNDFYKKENGDKVEETQWHNIVAWNGTAKIVEKLLKKGSEVAIEGKLTSRSWEDKEGNKHYITEVITSELVLIKTKA